MSSKSYSNTIRLVSYLIAAVALAQVVLMFVPYYNNGEVTTSIQGYVWTQYAAFKDYFKTEFANRGLEYAINSQVGAPILMLVLGVAVWKKFFAHPFGRCALTLVLAGAVGNLIDRALQGYVVDMFNVLFMDFAIFNVADICVVVGGIAACVYYVFFYEKLEGKGTLHEHADADR